MKKLYKVIINHSGCKRYSAQLLNGDSILITHENPYITSDIKELQHLGSQTFLKVLDAEDKDYKNLLLDTRFLPEVKKILNIEDAKEFLWKDDQEDMVIKKLTERGYFVSKDDPTTDSAIELSDEALIAMLRDRGYIGFRKSKPSQTDSKTVPKPNTKTTAIKSDIKDDSEF